MSELSGGDGASLVPPSGKGLAKPCQHRAPNIEADLPNVASKPWWPPLWMNSLGSHLWWPMLETWRILGPSGTLPCWMRSVGPQMIPRYTKHIQTSSSQGDPTGDPTGAQLKPNPGGVTRSQVPEPAVAPALQPQGSRAPQLSTAPHKAE